MTPLSEPRHKLWAENYAQVKSEKTGGVKICIDLCWDAFCAFYDGLMLWAETFNESGLMFRRARQILKWGRAESDADRSLIAPLSNIFGVSMMRRDFNQEDLIQQEAGSSIPLKKRSSSAERDALRSGVLEDGNCAPIRILGCCLLLKMSCLQRA